MKSSQKITGLEVGSIDGDEFYKLPVTYSQPDIPVTHRLIPTEEAIKKWSHLQRVKIPSLEDADIGLLIGNNAPKLHEPWEVIHCQDDGPYATKTALGWAIYGLTSSPGEDNEVHTGYIAVTALPELIEPQQKHDFPEVAYSGKVEMSQEDKRSMSITEEGNLHNGRCQLPLPFKNRDHKIPKQNSATDRESKRRSQSRSRPQPAGRRRRSGSGSRRRRSRRTRSRSPVILRKDRRSRSQNRLKSRSGRRHSTSQERSSRATDRRSAEKPDPSVLKEDCLQSNQETSQKSNQETSQRSSQETSQRSSQETSQRSSQETSQRSSQVKGQVKGQVKSRQVKSSFRPSLKSSHKTRQ